MEGERGGWKGEWMSGGLGVPLDLNRILHPHVKRPNMRRLPPRTLARCNDK